MESAKSTLAVALADERLGKGWQRSSTRIRVVAVLCSLLAALVMYGLFERFRVSQGDSRPQRQTIAEIDLRIGNPAGAAERGEAKARMDVEAGRLQLEVFGAATPAARAQSLKQRYGFAWVIKGKEADSLTQAHADAYNRVMQAEIERRHGREVLDQLMSERGISPVKPKEGA
ncbi:hypothetical protein J2X20_004135 [Pelomonas saccharophila]|uniref:Uncharacterized protein n=1 Tax=Roseateles saccharophilus TaxID=304 RepID=A0ABU1YRI1_ROSSA|nr:hypothetical protein [Roseateles saccharophilus]MDR7271467.1 hypothetical protein [Roseateles saccharophilus]